jgi:hypothetical protein
MVSSSTTIDRPSSAGKEGSAKRLRFRLIVSSQTNEQFSLVSLTYTVNLPFFLLFGLVLTLWFEFAFSLIGAGLPVWFKLCYIFFINNTATGVPLLYFFKRLFFP